MKYLAFLGSSLIIISLGNIILPFKVIFSTIICMVGIWLILEARKGGIKR